eukprot:g44401.t1
MTVQFFFKYCATRSMAGAWRRGLAARASEVVTAAQAQAFQQDGVVKLPGLFRVWLDLLARAVDAHRANPSPLAEFHRDSPSDGSVFFDDYSNYEHPIKEIEEFVRQSDAGAAAAKLMDPGVQRRTPWHHDQPYYPFDGSQNVSMWIPLDPVPVSSTIRFLRGSHRGPWYIPRKFATMQNYPLESPLPPLSSKPAATAPPLHLSAVPDHFLDLPATELESATNVAEFALEPGDAIAFHFRTLHEAGGNLSLQRARRVLVVRFFGDDSRRCKVNRPWKPGPPILGDLAPGQFVSESSNGAFPRICRGVPWIKLTTFISYIQLMSSLVEFDKPGAGSQ